MPPQQRTASPSLDPFTRSHHRSILISHSSQSTFSMHKRDQDLASATLRTSWTHEPTWIRGSFIPQQEQQQQQQQQQRPLNNTTYCYDNYYYNVYPRYNDRYSYNEYPHYYYNPAAAIQTTTLASTTTQTATPDTATTTTTGPTTPRSFAASLESSPSCYRLFSKEQQQLWGQASEYQTAFSHNRPHFHHTTKDSPEYHSFSSSNASSVVNLAPFNQDQQQPRVYRIQSNNNHWCTTAGPTPPRSSPKVYSSVYESARSQKAQELRGQDGGSQTALSYSRHQEPTDRARKQTNPESYDTRWTPEDPILEQQPHQPYGYEAEYKTTLGYNYYTTPETTPPRSSRGSSKSHSSACQSTVYTQQTHASQGYESDYKTASSNNFHHHHHGVMNQEGYHSYPESHEPQWTYDSRLLQKQQQQQEQQQRPLLTNNDGAGTEYTPAFFYNTSQNKSYYHAKGTSMPHSLTETRESSSIQPSRSLQQQQQTASGNSIEIYTTLNSGYKYRPTLNPAEHRSLSRSHEAGIIRQGGFSLQQQQLDRGREHVTAFGNNQGNIKTMNGTEYRLFPSMRDCNSTQRGCFPYPQRQQAQGHEDNSRVVDNSSNYHNITMSSTTHKPGPRPPLQPSPAAASTTHSSGKNGLLLTKAFCPSDSDSDDWLERLLEEESVETKGYLESFTDVVAYERYRTQLERANYERRQKLEARAGAIAKAKADGQAKYQTKTQNKIKNAISEVLFSRL
ncbi:MAG: hypothetical protein JOS17DRAFT_844321 [Linnemannia elongata]|nr:MAG: hypothetical protein JOS17DRAFT_844321 [Linnemannia elongata]